MSKAVAIRNPLVIQRIMEEKAHGAGRNPTEAAENLILQEAERRRVERARGSSEGDLPRPSLAASAT